MVKRCHQTETQPIELSEIWSAIKSGDHDLKERISQIRNRYEAEKDITGSAEKAKKAIADLKLDLPGFLPSGAFTKRENGALVEYSGFCALIWILWGNVWLDQGGVEVGPFCPAVALSPSGDGLKVFVNVINDPIRSMKTVSGRSSRISGTSESRSTKKPRT
jgi:hypothetical protein